MIQPITKERWNKAQVAEVKTQTDVVECHLAAYNYFRYLGVVPAQSGKAICEIGCGAYPTLRYCENVVPILIEPLLYDALNAWAMKVGPRWYPCPVEKIEGEIAADEVWLFNVMQHVIDPELFISKCKQIAPVIRFFEPIDEPITDYHPHTYSMDDFIRWFGNAERYKGGSDEGFHTADCAYGTWRR